MDFDPAVVKKLAERARRYEELTLLVSDPDMMSDTRRMPKLLRERGSLEESARMHQALEALVRRRREAEEILASDPRGELAELAREDLAGLDDEERALDEAVKLALVADPDDDRPRVIVEIRAGTGGDEATLFAADLFRMYSRYCQDAGLGLELFDEQRSEVGGFKEIIFGVSGVGAWRRLRYESGGHRVQRVPATESQGRVHTSAATVAVLAEAEEAEVELHDDDLRIDTMRAGGAGGQHVNKTESAVRVTHLPSGIVVVCQDERSQVKNKARALRVLRARLFEAEQERLAAERSEQRRTLVGSGDRSQRVRTYNYPQNRVTDHRLEDTDRKSFSLEPIVEGRLGALIDALAEKDRRDRLAAL
jgi:peptide chain release factor 1